ncbi:geranylgeranyl pyrophosphate synthase [Tessaracoccus lapidicaptus]|uniref:Geranylgeranyl pyrophosphate synthase n=1 Tax=Tessaracoccus lapidicaptus TaxID=1427523 RepID=A0A1C0AHD3_9ACTN|nr:geranylgeranyl pyrophosphate synthase [Tessaracoccus sp. T2.5-30]OCL31381.1 geranylgeranyl pyrophosphate synthase [Tessaracoccus lapidicaptus]VEP41186.1 Heptaprenyl diphosphate synthase component 2 [Tessaracoccus lapidicaptus]
MADATLDEHLTALLDTFEERLVATAVAGSPFVTEASRHIIAAGGKRFRPLLVFLAARFGGAVDHDDLMRAALVMELTHVASLYHDDVMDMADLRRGAPSANRLWGNSVAILVGDYLFARASTTVAELGVEYVALQAETFARLVQGQIAETKGPGPDEDPLAHYIQVIADKTGSLIAASALFGGMVAGADRPVLDALAAFGEEVGLVFQLSDDLIDITSTKTGKTPGTDLREGVPTLPVLMLRAENDPADSELLALIDGDLSDDAVLADVLRRLRTHPVMGRAKAEVERRADVARAHLAPLPDGEAKDALLKVCTDLVDRTA